MTFEVVFSNQATRFIRSLPEDIINRIKNKFKEVAISPFRYLEHYEGRYYKLRIGDFRALIDVDFQARILYVRVFDKRGRVYK